MRKEMLVFYFLALCAGLACCQSGKMSIEQDGTQDPAFEEAHDTISDDSADFITDMDADDGASAEDVGGIDGSEVADAGGDVSEAAEDLEDDGPPPCTTDCVPVVWVPAATFLMGAVNIPGESRPQHDVTLTRGFWMDKYEVSVAKYRTCEEAGACPPPLYGYRRDERPVKGVTWEMAGAYCAWAGKRLPTEAEWEHAACGDGIQCYPWGGEKIDWDCTQHPDCSMAAFCPESGCAGDGPCYGNPQDVTAFEADNVSPFGVVNMGGNVWEWVQDAWTPNFEWCLIDCVDPQAPGGSENHVFKGGAWISEEVFLRCAARYHDGEGGFDPYEVGLRCVQDPWAP